MKEYNILPKSQSGKKALYLMLLVILLAISTSILPTDMKTPGIPNFSDTPVYALLVYGRIITSLTTAGFAIIAIYKEQEKGFLIITALAQGFIYLISVFSVIAAVYLFN